MLDLEVRVNGRDLHLRARARHTLVDVLRSQEQLFGLREGCGVGMCGACTVLLDGLPVSGCLVLAPMADGRDVVTVEGLGSDDAPLDPVQQAFIERTAFQCSYCTPGFILAAVALLRERPTATDAEIVANLSGNLCRCGSYSKIREAVADARDRLATS
ncbi:MAG: (2Fe-2S)-binding protein [Candidatus Limnocylindrales bacterium]